MPRKAVSKSFAYRAATSAARNVMRRRMRRRYNARAWAPAGLRDIMASARRRRVGRPYYSSLSTGRVPYSGPLRRDGTW